MRARRLQGWIAGFSLLLSACGGGGGGSASGGASPTASVDTTPRTFATSGCSLLDRQNWAAAQLREWYLFPETLPASLAPAAYGSVDDYIDALTATARSQRRDRYFTYLTSIASEDAYYASGSSAGFGFRLATNRAAGTVTVTELFENGPAYYSGIRRGSRILAIGTQPNTLRTVADILASEGEAGIVNALGPSTVGTSRSIRYTNGGGSEPVVSPTKGNYTLDPVSANYGVKILNSDTRRVGYINLRTFITTAEAPLRTAFAQFRAAGITDFIVDLRYNGGGLVSTAQLLGRLLGGNRTSSDVFAYQAFRPEKSSNDTTLTFQPQAESVSPNRIAFITTGGTASASELVINAMIPFLHANVAIVGANTYGKPVGQIALDRAACDDRLRVVAFATQNAARNGNYFDGLAATVEASCQAADDLANPLGDAQESSIRAALDFLAGRPCSRIAEGTVTTQALGEGRRVLLTPDRPDTAQREVPGLF